MEWDLKTIKRLTKIAELEDACEGNLLAAKKAVADKDIEEWKAIARGNRCWVKHRLGLTLKDLGDGPVRSYYTEKHILRVEAQCKKSRYHGLYREFYANGSLYLETNYYKGKRHGVCRTFYESGALWEICYYEKNLKQGGYFEYYESGNVKLYQENVNGLPCGVCITFYEDGSIKDTRDSI